MKATLTLAFDDDHAAVFELESQSYGDLKHMVADFAEKVQQARRISDLVALGQVTAKTPAQKRRK